MKCKNIAKIYKFMSNIDELLVIRNKLLGHNLLEKIFKKVTLLNFKAY